jgi:hypothetical protein
MKPMESSDQNASNDDGVANVGAARRFSGRVAIVTGSTADPSIGRSCAFRLAREGASVVINGRDQDRLDSTETALRSEGFDVMGVVGSMDTEPAVAMLTDRAVEAFGRIDLIVSTLGGAPYPLSFDSISEEQLLDHGTRPPFGSCRLSKRPQSGTGSAPPPDGPRPGGEWRAWGGDPRRSRRVQQAGCADSRCTSTPVRGRTHHGSCNLKFVVQ